MKVSLKWLAAYVDLVLPPHELAGRLTQSTAEVERIEETGGSWDRVRIGEVTGVAPHPNADRLRLATVNAGDGPKTVVCGAPNLAIGQRIAFAEIGAHLIDGHTRKPAVLKANKIRGIESAGMVCSERELGLSDEHEGILVLPESAPIGVPLRDYLGDVIFDLYDLPQRPDLQSMIGVAREVAALTGQQLREPEVEVVATGSPAAERVSVDLQAPDLCARYVLALLEDVIVGESPAWLQERLIAAGMRPINNVVDITNYVMLEYGQPQHAFDYDRIAEGRIIVRRGQADELLRTLDGVERRLDGQMLVIADPRGPVGLAGVMGGSESEVHAGTRRVLLESANFDGINIRRTGMQLGLRSEASARFEKSIGPEVAMIAARRAVQLLVEYYGATAAGFVDVYPGKSPAPVISVTEQRIQKVLGMDVEPVRVRQTLSSLGFSVDDGPPQAYRAGVPYWRTDVRRPDDVIEEIVRITGYDTIPLSRIDGRLPEIVTEPIRDLRLQVQDLLVSAGMQEVITYSLVSEEMLTAVRGGVAHETAPLKIVNPSSSEHVYLRTSLRPSILSTLSKNLRQRMLQTSLFETARVYLARDGDLPFEAEIAAGVLAGERLNRWGVSARDGVDFFDAKAIVELVLDRLGIAAAYEQGSDPDLAPGRQAQIVAGDATLGVVGQLHPELATRFDLGREAFLFELYLDRLLPLLGETQRYQPASRYPAVTQDLSLVVDEGVPAATLRAVIARGRFVTEVRPIDVYTGGSIPPGKKSVTFSISYQASDRTLTAEEVAQSEQRLLRQLDQQCGARLREAR